jgi:hypothetical protein
MPTKKAPAKPKADSKPKTTMKPKANMREVRASDDYNKAKRDQETVNRIFTDLVDRVTTQKNRRALDRQKEILDSELQKLNMIFRNENSSKRNRAIALAGMDGIKKRQRVLDKAFTRLAELEKQSG